MIDVLYLKVTNKDWFELSLKTLRQHLFNYGKIYVLQTNLDLSLFPDVIVINQSISLFLKRDDVTLEVMIIELNMGLLKDVSILHIPITYVFIDNRYIQDHIKPQLINKNLFLKLPIQKYLYPISLYFKSIDRVGIPNLSYTITITNKICCKTKSILKIKQYVKWNDKGFESLKKYLNL